MISLPKRKALPALLALAMLICFSVACKDFFTDPKVTSIAINADQSSVIIGGTDQLQAIGTYDDSSTKDLTGSVKWTSSSTDGGAATISSGGLVTGVTGGDVTVKATSGTISGTTAIVVGALSSITITPAGSIISKMATGTQQFTATGHYSGIATILDITTSVTWTSGNTTDLTFDPATPGLATILTSDANPVTITATSSAATGGIVGTTTITINP